MKLRETYSPSTTNLKHINDGYGKITPHITLTSDYAYALSDEFTKNLHLTHDNYGAQYITATIQIRYIAHSLQQEYEVKQTNTPLLQPIIHPHEPEYIPNLQPYDEYAQPAVQSYYRAADTRATYIKPPTPHHTAEFHYNNATIKITPRSIKTLIPQHTLDGPLKTIHNKNLNEETNHMLHTNGTRGILYRQQMQLSNYSSDHYPISTPTIMYSSDIIIQVTINPTILDLL